jgi:hypothetical protein
MGIFGDLVDGFGSFLSQGQDKGISVDDYARMVESLLEELGAEPKDCRLALESKGVRGWNIQKGSAEIIILIALDDDNNPTIEVFSPILKLPSQNILPFYRKCLELNRYLIGCATCVNEDKVLVRAELPLGGLDLESIALMILNVAGAADQLDDELADEFGAKLYREG